MCVCLSAECVMGIEVHASVGHVIKICCVISGKSFGKTTIITLVTDKTIFKNKKEKREREREREREN